MGETLKGLGKGGLFIAIAVGGFFLLGLLLIGTEAVSAWAYPFLSTLVEYVAVFGLPILLVLALVPSARSIAGGGLIIASYVFGVTLWMWALLVTLGIWGWFGVIFGLLAGGVGIVPIAMLASLVHGEWAVLGQLILGIGLTFGSRFGGISVDSKASSRTVG